MNRTTSLRHLLAQPGPIVAPGIYDALSARLAETAGFAAAYLTGFGVSTTLLGTPDIGLTTLTELVQVIEHVTAVTKLPVIADGEAGFGNAVNVVRAVREYERAGAAAIQIEDQLNPKLYQPAVGIKLVSIDEQVSKIKAALAARSSPDFLIVARSDAREAVGLAEAIKRGQAYAAAGADIIFLHWPRSNQELKEIAQAVKAPLIADYARGVQVGEQPILRVDDLHALGYKIVIYSTTLTFIAMKAVADALAEMRELGGLAASLEKAMPRQGYQRAMAMEEWRRLEETYLPPATPSAAR